MMDALPNNIMITISQVYIHVSNHRIVHFKYIQFCQLYLNKAEKA